MTDFRIIEKKKKENEEKPLAEILNKFFKKWQNDNCKNFATIILSNHYVELFLFVNVLLHRLFFFVHFSYGNLEKVRWNYLPFFVEGLLILVLQVLFMTSH